ncbi:MAG: hypothetical protein IJP82_10105 [Bacteroidaceae bacterium]|nr:hypothetical protein [Bacteroidaceae bacterium]
MKNIFKHIAIASVVATGLVATSCEDMMTIDTGDKAYTNAQDTLYSYLGIMRAMQDVAERQVILGEIRGDLVVSTDYTTDTLYAISNFDNPKDQSCSMLQVSDYYNVINNCNFYIHNADTAAVKSNIKYMVPEYAQVKAIRAWAYLQLVKNYKEVPYITEPISNLGVIDNFDYANNLVNKDNLVDKLIEDGLLDFVETDYPQYGSASDPQGRWENGYTDIAARLMMIPIRVVLGDLYLLRGASTSDYEKAAQYYFDYLKNETTPLYQQFCGVLELRTGNRNYINFNGWGTWAATYNYSASTNEVISLIPSSANAGLGKMLTRVADIYGYTPTSSQSSDVNTSTDDDGNTSNSTDANGNETYSSSGAITVTRNYRRQYGPSNAFQDVVNQQTYVSYTGLSTNLSVSYVENCDARYGLSVEDYSYEGEGYPLCCKAASGSSFYYTIPTYRKTLIWLRMAEAINRAGYPEFAFAILKDGINQYTLPEVVERYDLEARLDANGDSIPVWNSDSTKILRYEMDTIYYKELDYGTYGAMYYVTDSARLAKFNTFLNFKDEIWNATYGIHAKGAGCAQYITGNRASFWSSADQGAVTTSIGGYRDSIYYDYSKLLLKQGIVLGTASQEDVINAVENIIVDELALETAFEGNRFTDLVRIAEHKTASGYDGIEWLAQKIANRGTKAATNTAAAVDGYDADIYSKLKNTANWYFALPAWTTK